MIDSLDPSVTEALRAWRTQHSAGIGLPGALETCADVCQPVQAKSCFKHAASQAAQGAQIESLLKTLTPVLTQGERAVIAAGWNGGRAEAAFDAVTSQRDLWSQTRRKIRSRMALPAAVLLIASFVAPLPQLISGGSAAQYLCSALAPLLIALALWQAGTRLLQRGPGGAGELRSVPPSALDRLFLKTPVLKAVERQRCLGEFSALLGNLIGAGVPVTSALDTCANALSNGVHRAVLLESARVIRQGGTLHDALRQNALWPPEFVLAVKVGEHTGQLDEVLARQADAARGNFERAVDAFAEWLPRMLYGCVALFVIFNIAAAIMQIASLYSEVLK